MPISAKRMVASAMVGHDSRPQLEFFDEERLQKGTCNYLVIKELAQTGSARMAPSAYATPPDEEIRMRPRPGSRTSTGEHRTPQKPRHKRGGARGRISAELPPACERP